MFFSHLLTFFCKMALIENQPTPPKIDKDDFRNFVLLVEQTRQAQKQYFKTRSKLHLEIAVKKEQQTDEEINRLFALYKLGNNQIF